MKFAMNYETYIIKNQSANKNTSIELFHKDISTF
jgi:hypothetical protein